MERKKDLETCTNPNRCPFAQEKTPLISSRLGLVCFDIFFFFFATLKQNKSNEFDKIQKRILGFYYAKLLRTPEVDCQVFIIYKSSYPVVDRLS